MDLTTKDKDHSELLPDYYVGVQSKYVFSKSVVQEHIRNDKRSSMDEKKEKDSLESTTTSAPSTNTNTTTDTSNTNSNGNGNKTWESKNVI